MTSDGGQPERSEGPALHCNSLNSQLKARLHAGLENLVIME